MKTYLKLLCCLLCSACFSTNQDEGAGLPELDTTEAGLTTGAVIGAGVGALVGSTSGDAGTGAVLGTIAGATSGGLIGKTIEGQERRIDKHDAKAGIDTRKKTDTGRASLGDTIWSSAASSRNLGLDDGGNFNRPSGRKGVAAKYVPPIGEENIDLGSNANSGNEKYVQIRQLRRQDSGTQIVPHVALKTENNLDTPKNSRMAFVDRGETALPPAAKSAPRIELQKPKAELPSFSSVPMRKPSLDNGTRERYSNLSAASKKSTDQFKDSSRGKLAEVDNASQVAKSELIKSNSEKQVKSTQKVQELPSAVENEEVQMEQVPAKSVKTVEKVENTICSAGSKDYERAKSASSDSDKVFYLRRVILACPKDSSSRIQLGKVYSKLGLKDEAKKEFNSVLELDPNNESAQDEMSIMMLDSRKN